MLVVVSDMRSDEHDTGPGHPESPARITAALAGIHSAGLEDAVVVRRPRSATLPELARVHRGSYLEGLRSYCDDGGGDIDADTVAGPRSWEAALRGAGATLVAVDALRRGEGEAAFVAMRPPGHHATADQAMGFCLVNNVAVAAASLVAGGERVLVVDWDVHHGNGTQGIFWDEPNVLYLSTHQWPLYPGSGRAEESGGPGAPGSTFNVPVPAGATGDVLLQAVDELFAPVVEHFAPDWVLVSAGFDAHRRDPLANLALSAGDFADLGARIRAMAPLPGRTVLVLEGGYDATALELSVGATLAGVLGERYRPEPSTTGGPGASEVEIAGVLHDASIYGR